MSDVVLRELHTLLRAVPDPADELRLITYEHLGSVAGELCVRTRWELGFVLRLPGGRLERAPATSGLFVELGAARRGLPQLGVTDYRAAKQRWWRECRRQVTRELPQASGWALVRVRQETEARLASGRLELASGAMTLLA